MRAATLKKKYSEFWENVEQGVLNDFSLINDHVFGIDNIKRIAYNAAFLATWELHQYLKKNAA